MDFGWSNAEIGRKMADGQLLFLALGFRSKHPTLYMYKVLLHNSGRVKLC